jgi:hypothetical protein
MSNTDDQRAAFEAWCETRHLDTERYECGVYEWYYTEAAWIAWQAAIEHAKKTMCNRN